MDPNREADLSGKAQKGAKQSFSLLGPFKKNAITWEIVKNNQDKPWNWKWLSLNIFNKYPHIRKKLLLRKYFKKMVK